MGSNNHSDFFKSKVLGHPSGLFVLFFTEMWERFSFYGMRVLLINFLTMAAIGSNPGWAWSSENAGALFGTYAGLLYLTPIVGGIIADRYLGYSKAVIIGCIIMTLGHISMAFETEFSLYSGLALLVLGTGFFKPNITSIIAQMYKDLPEKKDGAYTIFYMGVNAGAFFGMMLCGYLAEKIGWSWGFGLAGVFMLLGCIQFAMAKPLFGTIGDKPKPETAVSETETKTTPDSESYKANPFTVLDKVLITICSIIGLLYLLNDPISKIGNIHLLPKAFLFPIETISGATVIILIGLALFLFLVISRIIRYDYVLRDRMFAVIFFVFFTVFFVLSFEQGATSLVIFARDFTQRTFEGSAATTFIIVDALLTFIPLLLITWVLFKLFKQTFSRISLSNIFLGLAFVGVWGLVIWKTYRDVSAHAYEVTYNVMKSPMLNKKGETVTDKSGQTVYLYTPVSDASLSLNNGIIEEKKATLSSMEEFKVGDHIKIHEESGNPVYVSSEMEGKIKYQYAKHNMPATLTTGKISQIKDSQIEITASWFSILNSFFIIVLASLVSKVWESRFNPSAPIKFGIGLIITAIGFAFLAYGSTSIPQGASPGIVRVSMIWLIVAYFFHTLGELCIQPVGLSYVSKLVPGKMIAFMFGMWYLAIAIGNKLAGSLGGKIEEVTSKYDMSTFFLIFTIVPVSAGLLLIFISPLIRKLMHGIK